MNIDVYRGFFQLPIQGKGDRFAGQRLNAAFADADLRNGLGSAAILLPHGPAAGHHQGRTVAPGMDEFTLPVARTQNPGFDRLPRLWKLGV